MAPSKMLTNSAKHGLTDLNSTNTIDWLNTIVNGGTLLLTIVSDASRLAPIPYLQQAAGIAIKLAQTVQAMKDNKMAFRRIAHQAMELIAAIYQAYERSSNKAQWPPPEIGVVIEDLLVTVQSIYQLAEKRLSKKGITRFLSSATDLQLINEYRERLQASVNQFEVASHLSIHDTLSFIVKAHIEAEEQRNREKAAQAEQDRLALHRRRLEEEARIREREEARRAQQAADEMLRQERESGEAHDAIMRIHYVTDVQLGERDRIAAENEAREQEIRERELERERMAKEDEERLAKIQAEEKEKADLVKQLKEEAEVERRKMEEKLLNLLDQERKKREEMEREADLEIARLYEELEKAKAENFNRKGKGKKTEAVIIRPGGSGPHQVVGAQEQASVMASASLGRYSVKVKQRPKRPVDMRARVETEDEDEDSEQTVSEEDSEPESESESEEESPPPPPPPPPARHKKSKKNSKPQAQTPEQHLRQQLLALGIDVDLIQNRNTLRAGADVGMDTLGAAYAHLSVNSAAQLAPPSAPAPQLYSPRPQPPPSPYPSHPHSPPPGSLYPQYYGPPAAGAYISSLGYVTPPSYGYAPSNYPTGNITNTTISNVGNNYSVSTIYGSPPKKKKRAERV